MKNEPPAAGHTIKSTDFFPANKFDRPKTTPSPLCFAHSMTTTTSPSKAQLQVRLEASAPDPRKVAHHIGKLETSDPLSPTPPQSYQSGLSPSVPIRIVSHQYARSGASYS